MRDTATANEDVRMKIGGRWVAGSAATAELPKVATSASWSTTAGRRARRASTARMKIQERKGISAEMRSFSDGRGGRVGGDAVLDVATAEERRGRGW